jgi:hypothetical protein
VAPTPGTTHSKEITMLKDQTVELLPSRTTMRARTKNVQINLIFAKNVAVFNGGYNFVVFK